MANLSYFCIYWRAELLSSNLQENLLGQSLFFSSLGPWSWFCVFCVARVLIVQCICPNAIWNNKLIPAPVPGFMYSNFSRFVPGKDLESNVSFLQETCETAVRHPLKFHYLKEGNFKGEKGAISRKRLKLYSCAHQCAKTSSTFSKYSQPFSKYSHFFKTFSEISQSSPIFQIYFQFFSNPFPQF